MDMMNSSDTDLELDMEKQDHRWAELGLERTLDTLIKSIRGTLNYNCRQFRYLFSDFTGDVVFFGQSFLASGTCIHTNLRLNLRTQAAWSLDYDSQADRLSLLAGSSAATFENVSNAGSAAQLRFSIPENRVIFAVRKRTPFPHCTLNPGSNIIIN